MQFHSHYMGFKNRKLFPRGVVLVDNWSRPDTFQLMVKIHEVIQNFSDSSVFLFSFPKALSSVALEHFKSLPSNPIFKQIILSVPCHTRLCTHTHTHQHHGSLFFPGTHAHQTEFLTSCSVE